VYGEPAFVTLQEQAQITSSRTVVPVTVLPGQSLSGSGLVNGLPAPGNVKTTTSVLPLNR
jgi:hypothetical protein